MNQFAQAAAVMSTVSGLSGIGAQSYQEPANAASPIDLAFKKLADAVVRVKEGQQYIEDRASNVTIPYGVATKGDANGEPQPQRCRIEEFIYATAAMLHDVADRQEALGKAIQL